MSDNQSFWKGVFSDVKKFLVFGKGMLILCSIGFSLSYTIRLLVSEKFTLLDSITLSINYGFISIFYMLFSAIFIQKLNICDKLKYSIYWVMVLPLLIGMFYMPDIPINSMIITLSYVTSSMIVLFYIFVLGKKLLNYLNGNRIELNSEYEKLQGRIQQLEEQIEQQSTLTPKQIKENKLKSLFTKDKDTLKRIDNTSQNVVVQ